MTPPTLFFLYKHFLFFFYKHFQILISLPFHINFRISLPIYTKNIAWVLIGITLNLDISLGKTDIFMTMCLPVHELLLFRSAISFVSVL